MLLIWNNSGTTRGPHSEELQGNRPLPKTTSGSALGRHARPQAKLRQCMCSWLSLQNCQSKFNIWGIEVLLIGWGNGSRSFMEYYLAYEGDSEFYYLSERNFYGIMGTISTRIASHLERDCPVTSPTLKLCVSPTPYSDSLSPHTTHICLHTSHSNYVCSHVLHSDHVSSHRLFLSSDIIFSLSVLRHHTQTEPLLSASEYGWIFGLNCNHVLTSYTTGICFSVLIIIFWFIQHVLSSILIFELRV